MSGRTEFLLFKRIKRDAVEAIARTFAESRNWPWFGEVKIHMGLFTAHVVTNAGYKGGNVHVWVSLQTGEVMKAQFFHR
jgi:hypothetical protein